MSHLHRQLAAQASMAQIPAEKCAHTLRDAPSPKAAAKKAARRGKKKAK